MNHLSRFGATWLVLACTAGTATASGPDDIPAADALIRQLRLEKHVEGGYFRRTYESGAPRVMTEVGKRHAMTSIFYLLTADSPTGHFHRNRSDIVHYYHLGDPITYYLISPDGHLETRVMGPDPGEGHLLQMTVPGGIWKASSIDPQGGFGYGLISEAVSPGFDYRDMEIGERQQLLEAYPDHADIIRRLSRPPAAP